jgi:predicted RNA-binding Zn-ribbon protein involved in translation (DUF1610 family)
MTNEPPKPVPPKEKLALGEPYCGACGHRLTGLVDSSKCPECGRPIVEVLTRAGKLGTRYRSRTTLFGLPLVDVAIGGTHDESTGSARGIFALGDNARGFVAVGGKAVGIVAVGGTAFGVFAVGGIAIGLLSAWGGVSVGAMAAGGFVLGLMGYGGVCVAVLAGGGVAIGLYALGGSAGGLAVAAVTGQEAADVFRYFTWFFGPPRLSLATFIRPNFLVILLPIAATVVAALMVAARHLTAGAPARS